MKNFYLAKLLVIVKKTKNSVSLRIIFKILQFKRKKYFIRTYPLGKDLIFW